MKNSLSKIRHSLCFLLSILVLFSSFAFTAYADSEQNQALISITSSDVNPQIGDIITVTVRLENYVSMRPRIAAMELKIKFDNELFDYVINSEKSLLPTLSGDAVAVTYDGTDIVEYYYAFANGSKEPLPRKNQSEFKVLSFQLKAKSELSENVSTTFSIESANIYNNDPNYRIIECLEPEIDTVNIWVKRPPLLLNNSDINKKNYTESVEIFFSAAEGQIVHGTREPQVITSPYVADANGTYTVTVVVEGVTYSQTFTVTKTVKSVSVKTGTLSSEYALEVDPDYSTGVLLVRYTDDSISEIPCDDPDVIITGFNKSISGKQTLKISYQNVSTTYSVTVLNKHISNILLSEKIAKTEYLVGDTLDLSGGKLFIYYDDGTDSTVSITKEMISSFDNATTGEKILDITYGSITLEDALTVVYYSRDNVNALIAEIDAINISSLTKNDYETIISLKNKYDALSGLEKTAVSNSSKLSNAIDYMNSLLSDGSLPEVSESDSDSQTASSGEKSGNSLITVIIIILVIVIISILVGGGYFVYLFMKKKREDEENIYYEDDLDNFDLYDESDNDKTNIKSIKSDKEDI